MNRKRIGSFLLALLMVLSLIHPSTVGAQDLDRGDVSGDWAMPVEGTYDLKGHLKKMHIQYDGVGEDTIEFSLQFQSTVSPPGINHVDFRVDPRIKQYIAKVEGKGKGALSLGESYVSFKDRSAAPGAHNKNVYRAKLDGINGLFTALPWGAQVYEAKIIVHLNKKVNELKALFPNRYYTFETRAVGTEGGSIDGEIIKIDKNSLRSATFVKFEDTILTEDESRWLRSNSTAVVEYESGGTLTTNKDNARSGAGRERVAFGQGVMRIKYYIYPHMMIWDSYTAQIDQYKHYSFALNIDPKLKALIPDDAKLRVNALRLYGGAYNHLELPKSYINDENQLRISIYGTEKLNNEDKNVNQVVDPLVTKPNMYISVDADGSLPTYLQIEIPIDETKAEKNFDYNQYNFQGFYYNRRGQLVKNSLARTFTNAALTDQMPGITAEGTARLWGDEVKGNSEYPGSEIYLVANPDLDSEGNGIPGTGKVIGQMTTENKDFVIKTFAKDSQAHDPNNPNLFKDIINPATGVPYKANEKVYVFQAKPGRMMSKGFPVTLIEEQTNKPEVEPVYAKERIKVNSTLGPGGERYFKTVSGTVDKLHEESPIDVKMIWHGDGAKLINAGTNQETVSGGKQKGIYTAQRVPKGETLEQTGDDPHFIVNFDGTFSYYEEVGFITGINERKTFQVGDIIEVIATEEHCKESVHTYYVIGEEATEAVSRKPQVGILYPTLPDVSSPDAQIDSNFNKPNRDGDKSFAIRVQGGAKWRVEYFPAGATTPVEISGQEKHGGSPNTWYDVYPQLPEKDLQPGDVVKVYQKKKLGWLQQWAAESVATTTIVQQHPEEYFGYTIQVYLEGKEGPQETIYVHKDGQIYPNDPEIGGAILNYIQADAPELPFPSRLKEELVRPERIAHNYVYNQQKSTKFPITVTRDYKAFWDNLGVSLDAANKASFAGNVFELHFDRDAARWADLLVDSGTHGHFTKASLVASDAHQDVFMEETEGKVAIFAVKGIETNVIDEKSPENAQGEKQPRNLTWAEIKADKGIADVNIIPVANPGYKFTKYIDMDSNADYILEDLTEIGRNVNIVAQYEIDDTQSFGYEIQYVYNEGTEDAPVYKPLPGKAVVKGAAPVETVVAINQDPVDGYVVSANQPKELTVEYVEDGTLNNKVEGAAEPTMRQVVQVVYEKSFSEKPIITTEPVMDTTELVEGTSSPYAGIKLYYAKNTAAAGEPENWVADTDRLIGLDTADKNGNWSVKVSDLTVGEKIIAVAKDPLKAETESDVKVVEEDLNKFDGSITIKNDPALKTGDQVVSGKINITPKPGEESPALDGVVVEIYKKDATTGTETLIGKSIANAEGNFDVAVNPPLEADETIVAKAQPKKSKLLTGEAVVAVNVERLTKDINDADEFLARPDIGNFDSEKVRELQDAVTAGKALLDAEGKPKPGVTQDQVNNAADLIEEKLKALNVNTAPFINASDKVLDVGDLFDPLAGVTVSDAQETQLNATVKSSTVPVNADNTLATVGSYEVVYTVTDNGNLTTERTVTVTVRENDKAALKVAIVKGENVLSDGKQYDPAQVKALEDAIAAGKVVDANPNATKTEIQEAKDAINTALTEIVGNVQASNAPTIDKVRHGDVLVSGKLADAENNPIANAEITIKDKATGKVLGIAKTDATGAYSVSVPALEDKQVIQAVAREEGKNASPVVEATVVPNTDKLTETIGEADDYIAANPLDPTDEVDNTLQAALDKAKVVKENAEKEPPMATQIEVDKAQKELEDALNAKKAKDTAETNKPTINELNNGDKAVTGKAVPGSTVTVTMPDGATYTAEANGPNGEYNVPTRPLVGGEVIKVTATVDGVVSNPAEATVVTDVAKLKDAIAKGETAAEGLDPNTTDPEDKELLDAIAAGKDILVDPTNPASPAKPGKTQKEADDAAERILAAIKAKETADENDANSMPTPSPEVDTIANGASSVTGVAVAGSTVTVTMSDGATYTATADETSGKFIVPTRTLVGGEVVNVTAKLPKRPESNKVPVTVVTDVNDLKAAIGEGETAMEKVNTPPTAEDTALQTAIDEGKALIVDPSAVPPVAKDGVTQKQADDAAQKIRDAIKAKEAKDAENLTAAEKEAKRQELIEKLKAAIKRGEDFQAAPGYEDVLPEDKAVLDQALAEAKKDLVELEKPDWDFVPDEVKVDKDIKDIDDAIANARKVSTAPTVNPIKHNSTTISGKDGNPGDTITVTLPDGFTKEVVVGANGKWSVEAPKPLISGEVVKAQVTKSANPKLGPSEETSVIVGLDTTGLKESFDKATPIVEDTVNFKPDTSNTDKALDDAYKEADRVLKDAATDNPTVTQTEVDAAKKALDDALAEKEKFETAKTALDTAKTTPSKETIADAQTKINAMNDGDDKAKLQKELDKIKLEEAINLGKDKLKEENLDPAYKDELTDAVNKATTDLEALNDADPSNDPTTVVVDADVKKIEDLVNNGVNKTVPPEVNGVVKGTKFVTGKAEPNAEVTIVTPFETATVKADAEGLFKYTSPEVFIDKQEVKVTAQAPGKTVSDAVLVIVGVDKSQLEQAIKDGNQALIDNPNTPPTNADNKLQEAINNGETVKNDPNATQEQVDEATQKIKEAMDQKVAEDAVKALEDKQNANDPLNPITPEEIQDAQDKIDKLPGSIADPAAPDYNADKKDLQDRLDKVKAVEELKDLVDKADEVLNDEEKIKEKPAEIVEKVVIAKEKGDTILVDNGATTEIDKLIETIKELKQALEDIEKDFVHIDIKDVRQGAVGLEIKTSPAKANIMVFVDGVLIVNGQTNTYGTAIVSVAALKPGQKILVKASADGYLDNTITKKVQ